MLSFISHQGNVIKTPVRYSYSFTRSNAKILGCVKCSENVKLCARVGEPFSFLYPRPSYFSPGWECSCIFTKNIYWNIVSGPSWKLPACSSVVDHMDKLCSSDRIHTKIRTTFIHEKILNITDHQGNTNQNYNKIPPHTH